LIRPVIRIVRSELLAAAAAAILLAAPAPAAAHVGSPDVFLEGDAGPYHLFVTVRVPQVIPGVAAIEVRTSSDDIREIRTTVTRLTGAGSKYAPVPDLARRSAQDPRFFTSGLWLMEFGSLEVRLIVDGARGRAEMAVPVASFAQQAFKMPRWLGAMLLVLVAGLAVGIISIVGAAAREAVLDPGVAPTPQYRRRGARAMAIAAAVAVAVFALSYTWWSVDAASYQDIVNFFKPPRLSVRLEGNRLILKPAQIEVRRHFDMMEVIPDHNHLMHLFVVRMPAMDRVWHLHPDRMPNDDWVLTLPSMSAGHYALFADIVHKSGFPITMVGAIDLPEITGQPLSGDDAGGAIAPLGSLNSDTFVLPDGGKIVWQREAQPLRAKVPAALRFAVQEQSGRPVADLQPYMGMAAHAAIVRSDLAVFAHVHPASTVPMASLMLVSDTSAATAGSLPSCPTSIPGALAAAEKIAPEISIPYGFPRSGQYRIIVEIKRHGQIETAAFDTTVSDAPPLSASP